MRCFMTLSSENTRYRHSVEVFLALKYVNIKSRQRVEFIDITDKVEEALKESRVEDGICVVFVPHTSAGVTINEGADPSVQKDINISFSRMVPHEYAYSHREGNSDAHIKSSMVGASCYIPIEDCKLVLGTWQAVYFCEFDGPRHRRVVLKFLKG